MYISPFRINDNQLKIKKMRRRIYDIFLRGKSIKSSSPLLYLLFRGEITPLSSSYNISGLVPVCWLLFQCF